MEIKYIIMGSNSCWVSELPEHFDHDKSVFDSIEEAQKVKADLKVRYKKYLMIIYAITKVEDDDGN